MKVYDGVACRLGNSIFRYLASSLFCIIYNAERTIQESDCNFIITEEYFREWCNSILFKNSIINLPDNLNFKFMTFYQTDIYHLYRKELIEWIDLHKSDYLRIEDDPSIKYYLKDLFSEISYDKIYDVVLHIRLEDFVTSGERLIIHPQSIENVLDLFIGKKICIVSNKISTDFEKKYMNYFVERNKYTIVFESNDIVTDFKIMNNAQLLICSLSTICWSAGFLSKKLEQVYFPKNRFPGWYNQSFQTIIPNETIYYDNILCNEQELNYFLDNLK